MIDAGLIAAAAALPPPDLLAVAESRSPEELGLACQAALDRMTGSPTVGIYLLDGAPGGAPAGGTASDRAGPRLLWSGDVPKGFLDQYAACFGAEDPLIRRLVEAGPVTDGEASVGAEAWRRSPLHDLLRSWGFGWNMCGLVRAGDAPLGVIYTAGRPGRARRGPEAMVQMGWLCRGAAFSLGGMAGPRAVPAPAGPPLPPQLARVAALLCEGASNKGIAREVGLSEHTVKEYVQVLIRRHGVENRTALAARLVRDGALQGRG